MKVDNKFLENFYNEYDEDGRLENNRLGKVEYLTTRRYLDPLLNADCKIAESPKKAMMLLQWNWYNIILTFLKASLMAARTSKHISAMRLT